MMREQTFHKVQRLLLILCLLFTLLIALVFIPICNKNNSLEEKVQQNYMQLLMLNRNTPYGVGLDMNTVQTNLNAIKPQIEQLRYSYLCQIQMLELPKEVLNRLRHSFQTFEYILTRNDLSNRLNTAATEKKITLDPSVLNNLPEYKYGITNQQSLWIKLAACQRTLESAFHATPSSIQAFELRPMREYIRSITNNVPLKEGKSANKTTTNIISQETLFIEIPIHIKFTGTTESVLSFLRDFKGSLPRSEEEKIRNITNYDPTPKTTNTPPPTTDQPPAPTEQTQPTTAATNPPATESADTPTAKPAPEAAPANAPAEPKTPAPTADGAKPTPIPTPEEPAPGAATPATEPPNTPAPAAEEKPAEPEPIFRNSIFLGPFEIYIAPDNPNHVVFDGIVSVIYRTPKAEELK